MTRKAEPTQEQIKCEQCERDDCLNILCHADLEVLKQEVEKETNSKWKKEIETLKRDIRFFQDVIKGRDNDWKQAVQKLLKRKFFTNEGSEVVAVCTVKEIFEELTK